MNRIYALILCLSSCQGAAAQVILSGSWTDFEKPFIAVGRRSSHALPPDPERIFPSGQKFRTVLETEAEALIMLDFSASAGQISERLFLLSSPGDSIHIEFAPVEGGPGLACRFSGSNAEGHALYHAFSRHAPIYYLETFYEILRSGEDADSVYRQVIDRLGAYTRLYEALFRQGVIDSAYFTLVTNRIKDTFLSSLISFLFRRDSKLERREKERLASALIQYHPPLGPAPLVADMRASYILACLQYQLVVEEEYQDLSEIPEALADAAGKGYRLRKAFTPILSVEDEALQEYLFAWRLHFWYTTMLGVGEYYDESLAYFRARFPQSRYISAIEKARQENPERLAAETGQVPEPPPPARYFEAWRSIIIDDVGAMEGLSFKNEEIDLTEGAYYVDIWATWCAPCLEAMRHNYRADSLLHAHGFRRLYISLDGLDNYGKWYSTIYSLHLGGLHVLAGEKLRKWLFENFGTGSSIKLPRYFFIRDGKVLNRFAPGPEGLPRAAIISDR